MITETLLALVMSQLEWFATLVPDFGLDLSTLDIEGFWTMLGTAAMALDGWAPVNETGLALATVLVVQVAMSGWGLLVWVYHQFWGSQ